MDSMGIGFTSMKLKLKSFNEFVFITSLIIIVKFNFKRLKIMFRFIHAINLVLVGQCRNEKYFIQDFEFGWPKRKGFRLFTNILSKKFRYFLLLKLLLFQELKYCSSKF